MRIAQVAPLFESVPPKVYGGTERVVSYLTEELVRQGHQVTLFASGDSITSAELVATCDRALRLDNLTFEHLPFHTLHLERVLQQSDRFDVIHFHTDCLHLPLMRRRPHPHVTTFHGRLDVAGVPALMREFDDMPVVSISNTQRAPLPDINWLGTVYHGLPPDLYQARTDRGSYLAFLGRISPEKRLDRAIEVAVKLDLPLKIAAKIDPTNLDYFETVIKPWFTHPLIEYVGEINDEQKQDFLGNAMALLFLIDWPEPFGLAAIEALACGTPVIAYPHGALPEILCDDRAGALVTDQLQAMEATKHAMGMDRSRCRAVFDERFSARRMANDYLEIYQRVIDAAASSTPVEFAWPPSMKSDAPLMSSTL